VPKKYKILVCRGPECGEKRHSADIHASFVRELAQCPLGGNEAALEHYSCFGKCHSGPNVLVRELRAGDSPTMLALMPTAGPGAVLYHRMEPGDAHRVVTEHIAGGQPIREFTQRK
jgi:(2Fe-2S) ferredoxin